jgi:hypothetical protein
MTAKTLLGARVFRALIRYRTNRDAQLTRPWDKNADLKHICSAFHQRRHALFMQTSAGTFWFQFESPKCSRVVAVDCSDLRSAKVKTTCKSKFIQHNNY